MSGSADMKYTPESLLSWVKIGHVEAVRSALAAGGNPNQKDEKGFAALFHATAHRRKEVIELLIEHGADVDFQNPSGDDVLDYAARRDDTEILDVIDQARKRRRAEQGS